MLNATNRFASLNAPEYEEERCEILSAMKSPENWSADGRAVLVRSTSGWFVLAERVEDGLISIHARKGQSRRTFWMNASSIKHIGDSLRAQPERKWKWPGLDRAFQLIAPPRKA